MKKALKYPGDYAKTERQPRYEPVATRVTLTTRRALEHAARSEGRTISWLAAKVLEEYALMLKGKP